MVKEKYISVIIPMYNAINTIERTINSLIEQTNSEFEIIIVNDGSTDGCDELVRQIIMGKLHPEIKLINIENKGVSYARNVGIANSKGTNILFLDADDVISRFTVDIIYNKLNSYDDMFYLWTRNIDDLLCDVEHVESVALQLYEVVDIFSYKKYNTSFFSFIYDRKVIDKFHIKFDERFKYGEDNLFFWNYVHACSELERNRFCFLKENLYFYYYNESSCMRKMSVRQQDAILAIFEAREMFVKDNYILSMLDNYLIPRTVMSVLKNYAVGGEGELFNSCSNQFDANKQAIKLFKSKDFKWKIMSSFFIIHKGLFYSIIRRMKFNK